MKLTGSQEYQGEGSRILKETEEQTEQWNDAWTIK